MFVHYSDIDDEVQLLRPTTKVDFECTFEEQGPVAHSVKKIIPKHNRVYWIVCFSHCSYKLKSGSIALRALMRLFKRKKRSIQKSGLATCAISTGKLQKANHNLWIQSLQIQRM